jgi:hypothetical protein
MKLIKIFKRGEGYKRVMGDKFGQSIMYGNNKERHPFVQLTDTNRMMLVKIHEVHPSPASQCTDL